MSQEPERAAMAAAPGEAPVPLAAPVLPLAKRVKKDPVLPATATAGWSSLPADLVRRIADCFLDTNDLDHYMDFRAVCPNWCAATDDPKTSTSDTSFYPRVWIVLDHAFDRRLHPRRWIHIDDDEVFHSDDRRLLLNTATGRFLHRKLPPLLDYYVVATTFGGFFLLADRSPPHAARLFNPLTGAVIRFAAPVPLDVGVADIDVGAKGDSLFLALLCDSSHKIYTAAQGSEGFVAHDCQQGLYDIFRNAVVVVGDAYTRVTGPTSGRALAYLYDLLRSVHGDTVKLLSSNYPEGATEVCFVVGVAEHMVYVVKTEGTLSVFKINIEMSKAGKVEPLQSVGRFAIFIGHPRCLVVDADKFPGIEADCVYYTEHLGSSAHICKYNLKDKKAERMSEAAEFLKRDKQFVLVADRPFTVIQLLCSYSDSELA